MTTRDNIFHTLIQQYQAGTLRPENTTLQDVKVEAPKSSDIVDLHSFRSEKIQEINKLGSSAIKKGQVGAIIATGGMATRFKYNQPKALFPVFGEETFLSLKIKDYKQYNIPVFLMVSFATKTMIEEYLETNNWFNYKEHIVLFSQFSFPRISTKGEPCADHAASGHGDVFEAIIQDDTLSSFIDQGGKYLLFSNIDNLGAVLATGGITILGLHVQNGTEMTIEVANKNPGDKGGAPALVNNKLQLVEGFLFPKNFDQDSIPVFNTATYIFDVHSIKKGITLPWYAVIKERNGEEVIQFERLAGDISAKVSNQMVRIDRSKRFLPVKKQEDITALLPTLEDLFTK